MQAYQAYQNTQPAPRTSNKYVFLSTEEIIDPLLNEGWRINSYQEANKRIAEDQPFSKHIMRLRNPDLQSFDDPRGGSSMNPEIVIYNSHDGLSSFRMSAGFYVMICSNGLTVGTDLINIRQRHQNVTQESVLESAAHVVEQFPVILNRLDQWANTEMSPAEINHFGYKAAMIRWNDEEKALRYNEDVSATVRRSADAGSDLWSVFNRSQEQLMQGFRPRNGGRKVRAVTAIDLSQKINTNLWNLAENFASN